MNAIEVRTQAGRTVYIETEGDLQVLAPSKAGGETAGGGDQIVRKLEEVGETIADVCRTLQDKVRSALKEAAPNELTLEFAVKLAGEAGIPLVSKGSVEGTFQVTAKWNFP